MIINDPSVRVRVGEIKVAVVDLVLDTEWAKAWHIGLGSKWADASSYAQDDGEARIYLQAIEETLDHDFDLRGTSTMIIVQVPDNWTILAECVRYTCRIVAYKAYKD